MASLALVLFALTFKALLPPGFMLTPAAERTITVTLCTAHGAVDVALPHEGAPQPTAPQKDEGSCVCAPPAPEFGTALVAAHLEAPPLERASLTLAFSVYDGTARQLAAPPPWPTGPPISTRNA